MRRLLFFLIGLLFMISHALALDIISFDEGLHTSVLKSPANPVTFPLDEEDRALIQGMKAKLQSLGGVGLAAPQVNQAKRIIAIYIPEEAALLRENSEAHPLHVMINPSFEPISIEQVRDFEGCYSVAELAGKVSRYLKISLRYQDEAGIVHKKIASGFYARVLQHEIDHLNGVLIKDRLTPDCIQGNVQDMMALRRSELSFEKQKLFDELMAKKQKR